MHWHGRRRPRGTGLPARLVLKRRAPLPETPILPQRLVPPGIDKPPLGATKRTKNDSAVPIRPPAPRRNAARMPTLRARLDRMPRTIHFRRSLIAKSMRQAELRADLGGRAVNQVSPHGRGRAECKTSREPKTPPAHRVRMTASARPHALTRLRRARSRQLGVWSWDLPSGRLAGRPTSRLAWPPGPRPRRHVSFSAMTCIHRTPAGRRGGDP